MSSLSESIARLHEETQRLAALVEALSVARSSSADESLQAIERCAQAMEQVAAALDGGRLRVVLDDPESTAARYS